MKNIYSTFKKVLFCIIAIATMLIGNNAFGQNNNKYYYYQPSVNTPPTYSNHNTSQSQVSVVTDGKDTFAVSLLTPTYLQILGVVRGGKWQQYVIQGSEGHLSLNPSEIFAGKFHSCGVTTEGEILSKSKFIPSSHWNEFRSFYGY